MGSVSRNPLLSGGSCVHGRLDNASHSFAAGLPRWRILGSSRYEPETPAVADGSAKVLARLCLRRFSRHRQSDRIRTLIRWQHAEEHAWTLLNVCVTPPRRLQ